MKRCSLVSKHGAIKHLAWSVVTVAGWISMPSAAWSQTSPTESSVVIQGLVPDDGFRSAVVNRVMALYGRERVVDRLSTGGVTASAQWRQDVARLLPASIKQVSRGQITLEGQVVDIKGEVPSEAVRQQVIADLSQAAGGAYTVKHGLKVVVPEQVLIDQALANRTVEFEPGSAVLTPAGMKLLDEMSQTLAQFKGRRFELIGHTDGNGQRASNIALSLARAEAVKAYLVTKGLSPQNLQTKGLGPDQPIASNQTDQGRARNRRIDFKLVL